MIEPISKTNNADRNSTSQNAATETYDSLRSDIANLSKSVKTYATENFGEAAAEVQDKAQAQLSSLESAVRKNPVQTAMIAAGIGLVVGLLVTR